jgi:hypothetical protein
MWAKRKVINPAKNHLAGSIKKMSPARDRINPSRISELNQPHSRGEFVINQRIKNIIVVGLAKYSIFLCFIPNEYQCNKALAKLRINKIICSHSFW